MITEDLFNTVLVSPACEGANTIYIVSGYASPAIIPNHFNKLPENAVVKLIIGMTGAEGLLKVHHTAFQRLVAETYRGKLEVQYQFKRKAVHIKSYSWFANQFGMKGFTGSPNYSNMGFFRNIEAVTEDDPYDGFELYKFLLPNTVDCLDDRVGELIDLYDVEIRGRLIARRPVRPDEPDVVVEELPDAPVVPSPDSPFVEIDLRDRTGSVPPRSGLNWGKRPEENRNPDQAYIHVPAKIGRSGFFPPRGVYFTIVTDDGDSFDGVMAQSSKKVAEDPVPKAIHTPKDNSIMGRYFRRRLGIPFGAEVKTKHLQKYGRTTVRFFKIDDETYYLDFSV